MRNMMVRLYSRCKKYGSSGLAMMMAVLFTMPAYASESGGCLVLPEILQVCLHGQYLV